MSTILYDIPRKLRVAIGHVFGNVNDWALHPRRGGTGVSVDTSADLPAALGVPTNGELTTALSSKADDSTAEHVTNKGAASGYAPLSAYAVPRVNIVAPRKSRRWLPRKNSTTIYSIGGEAPTSVSPGAAISVVQNAQGTWVKHVTNKTVAEACWIYSEAVARRNWNPRVTLDFQLNGITKRTLFVGLFSALPTTYSTLTGAVKCAALRFENPTDAENQWTFLVSDGVTESRTLLDGTAMPLDAFGTYRITIDYNGSNWTFEYNNQILATVSGASFGPAGATDLFWAMGEIYNDAAVTAGAAEIRFGDVTLETN